MPKEILYQHPFPGPGLAIRILGNVTEKRLNIVKKCDRIVNEELKKNKLTLLVKKIKEILNKINTFAKKDGSYQSDKKLAPLEDTRYSLFVINIIEDLIQDILYYYSNNINLEPITRIYQNISNLDLTYNFISK